MRSLALWAVCLAASSGQAQTYRLQRIETPLTLGSIGAADVNDSGEVLCVSAGGYRYWVARPRGEWSYWELPPGASTGNSMGLAENGSFSVWFGDANGRVVCGLWTREHGFVEMPWPEGAIYVDITSFNSSGQITGAARFLSHSEGFLYTPGKGHAFMPNLPGADATGPTSVNDHGETVGIANGTPSGGESVRWTPGSDLVVLGAPPGHTHFRAFSIAMDGTAGGDSFHYVGNEVELWLTYAEKGQVPVGVRPPERGAGQIQNRTINDLGHLIGASTRPDNTWQPCFWHPGMDRMRYVVPKIDGTAKGWKLLGGNAINNKGQIALGGWLNGNRFLMPVLLTPYSHDQAASAFVARTGKVLSGGVTDLAAKDGRGLVLERHIKPSSASPDVAFEFTGRVPTESVYMWAKTWFRTNGPGRAELHLWNRSTQNWDKWTKREAPAWNCWEYAESVPRDRLHKFIEPDGTVRARLSVSFDRPGPWTCDVDLAAFEYVLDE